VEAPDDVSQDSPIVRLANMLIINAIKRGASHVRVRSGVGGAAEERKGGVWENTVPSTPPKLWSPVVDRLKFMSNIPPDVVTQFAARMRLVFGESKWGPSERDFDVTCAATPTGAVIVLGLMPQLGRFLSPASPELEARVAEADARLATASVASERGDHDAVRRGMREAVADASAMGAGARDHAAYFLRRAASVALRAGLDEDAVELLERVVGLIAGLEPSDPAEIVGVERSLGNAYAALDRFDEAQPHFERAMQAAEAFGPENGLLVFALSSAGRCCARRGDLARAERLLERAEAVAEVLVGADSSLLLPRLELARIRRERDAAGSMEATRRVLVLAESFEDDWMSEQALGDLAEAELARGDLQAAAEHARLAIALAGPHPRSLRLFTMRARALSGLDRRSEALVVLRAAAEIARACRAPAHPDRVAIEGELTAVERSSPYRW
jgi:tetratricopeptide (TPR) repeat protein